MQAHSWPGQGFSFKLIIVMSQKEDMRHDLQYPPLSSAQVDTSLFASGPTRLLVSYLALGGVGPERERVSALKVEARKTNPKSQVLGLNVAGAQVWEKGLKTKSGPSKMGGGWSNARGVDHALSVFLHKMDRECRLKSL